MMEYNILNLLKNGVVFERFERQIVNDHIKDKYCLENNIKLLRIPYTDFDKIESILDNI